MPFLFGILSSNRSKQQGKDPASFKTGSKDESFYESQAYMDSDEDFYSVNGDFPSSSDDAPNDPTRTSETPKVDKIQGTDSEFSRTQSGQSLKKNLSQILQEPIQDEEPMSGQIIDGTAEPKPKTVKKISRLPNSHSTGTSEKTSKGRRKNMVQCCLPTHACR